MESKRTTAGGGKKAVKKVVGAGTKEESIASTPKQSGPPGISLIGKEQSGGRERVQMIPLTGAVALAMRGVLVAILATCRRERGPRQVLQQSATQRR